MLVPTKVSREATSLADKLRIANKVNTKFLESLSEKSKQCEQLEAELGRSVDCLNILPSTGAGNILQHQNGDYTSKNRRFES